MKNDPGNSREKGIFSAAFFPKEIQRVSEKSIQKEITQYFDDMTMCRKLKKFGPSFLRNESLEWELCSNSPVDCRKKNCKSKKLVKDLCEMIVSNADRNNGSASKAALLESLPPSLRESVFTQKYPFSVRCSDAKTVIIDTEPCREILNQLTVLAETILTVHVAPVFSSLSTSKDEEEYHRVEARTPASSQNSSVEKKPLFSLESRLKGNANAEHSSPLRGGNGCGATPTAFGWNKKMDSTRGRTEEECFSLSFYSTHFLDASCADVSSPSPFPGKKTQTKREATASALSSDASSLHCLAEPWCAIQSLVSLQNPAHLEFYTYHMVHFGLLCYSLWNVSSSWLKRILLEKEPFSGGQRMASELGAPQESFTRWPQHISHFFPSTSKDRILILGLGGNVLGSCLDVCLSKAVQLDIVEIEPAMFDICYRNGLIPSLSSPVPLVSQTSSSSPFADHFSPNDGRPGKLKSLSSIPFSTHAPGDSVVAGAIPPPKTALKQAVRGVPWVRYDAMESIIPKSASFAHFENIPKRPEGLQKRDTYRFYLMDANDFLQHRFLDPVTLQFEKEKTLVHSISSLPTSNEVTEETLSHLTAQTVHHFENKRDTVEMKQIGVPKGSTSPVDESKRTAHQYSDIGVDLVKYNLIFLDCYDPDQGTMVHNSSLLTRCRNRLSPGGALLINAHVDTDANTLTKCFLTQGFASVQVLKVCGCRQCIVVCLIDGEDLKEKKKGITFSSDLETNHRSESTVYSSVPPSMDVDEGLLRTINNSGRSCTTISNGEVSHAERFQLRVFRRFATYLNRSAVVRHSIHPLIFDPEWLARSSVVSQTKAPKSNSLKNEPFGISLCRVWEHHP